MGLIKAGIGSLGGALADQWRDYYSCDAMDADVLVVRGTKRESKRSSNTKGHDNIISNGSVIAVAAGQCMLIVEQGKIVEVCAEPGEFIYDTSTEPSVFYGNLGENIKNTFKTVGKRFTFGGDTGNDQRVYFVNTKELSGNKYGTPTPIPFRVVDERALIDIDISIKCFGEYSYHICDPLLFYTNVCANVTESFERSAIDGQLKSEFLMHMRQAFSRISAMKIRYSELMAHTTELADVLNDILTKDWREKRGIEIFSIGITSINASEEDEKMLKEMQREASYQNPLAGAARMLNARANAMNTAAANEAGAAIGFMGMGMANMSTGGGMNEQMLYQMGMQSQMQAQQMQQPQMQQPQPQAAPAAPAQSQAGEWTCGCGMVNTGKFCIECGSKKPEPQAGWVCSCGAVNKGKFCPECGAKKPAEAPLYRCDKCGWEPEDPKNPPKFCPECGDRFDEEDIRS